MKICFLINNLNNRAGTERSATLIANSLSKKGHEVSILSFVDVVSPGYEINKEIEIINLGVKCRNNKTGYLKIIKAIRDIMNKKDIDILIEAEVYNRLFTTVALRNSKTKVITWEHFNYYVTLGRPERKFARWLASKYSNAIVTLTDKDKQNYIKNLKCRSIVESISNTLVYYPKETAELDKKIVLAVGRFNYQKGFDTLINIWKTIESKNKGWILEIVGDGEDKEKIQSMIIEYNLQESVILTPATSNIQDKYINSSVYVMTSRFEGLPMVLIEAMSFGLPVVSFDCQTGPSELIQDGKNGFLIDDKNKELFREKLDLLLDNKDLRKSMGRNAKDSISNLDIEIISKKWIDLIERII